MEIRTRAERNALMAATNSLRRAVQDVKRIRETVEEKENLRVVVKKLLDLGLEIEDAIYMFDGKEAEEDDFRRAMDQGSGD